MIGGIGGLAGAALNSTGLVERKGSDKAVADIGPFDSGPMGVGGLAGMATQGGFMGNTGGMLYPFLGGLAGLALQQFGPKQHVLKEEERRKGFDVGRGFAATAGLLGMGFGDPAFSRGLPPTPMASMYGGPQLGQAGGLLGNANFFSDPMTIKKVS